MLFTRVKMTSKIEKTKEAGVKIINAYTVGETIGVGLFGKVKRVSRIENGVEKIYAMKILKKNLMAKKKVYYKDEEGGIVLIDVVMRTKDGFEFMHREIAVYKKIRHPNLIRLFEVLLNESK
jgi:serine/threonine protein kinase